jgi:acyl transferase domain-containing protein/acyl carrier protein
LFIFEYALAQQLIHWGVSPGMMLGHSVGEYVAACLAQVFTLEDAIILLIKRGRLIQSLLPGDMIGVLTDPDTLEPLLLEINHTKTVIGIAAINSPKYLAVSGDSDAIAKLKAALDKKRILNKPLHTSHAFHSHHMDKVLEEFRVAVGTVSLSAPKLPYISNVTGELITAEEATDPSYWVKHMRCCVLFGKGVESLMKQVPANLVEIGPGQVLSKFAQQNSAKTVDHHCISLTPSARERSEADLNNRGDTLDQRALFNGLGRLFTLGVTLDWKKFYEEEKRGIVGGLPTYPFERQAYWIPESVGNSAVDKPKAAVLPNKKKDLSDWFYLPSWKPAAPAPKPTKSRSKSQGVSNQWLIFEDEINLGEKLSDSINTNIDDKTQRIIRVQKGEHFSQVTTEHYQINPLNKQDYQKLVQALSVESKIPLHVVHLWSVYPSSVTQSIAKSFDLAQQLGFYSLIYFLQSFQEHMGGQFIHLSIITNNVLNVVSSHRHCPEKAGVFGLNRVISQEYPTISNRVVDISLNENGDWHDEVDSDQLLAELLLEEYPSVAAIRNGVVWVEQFNPITLPMPRRLMGLRKNGTYLITGGLGKIGTVLASFLASEYQANIILTSRSSFPDKSQWSSFVAQDRQAATSKKIALFQSLEAQGANIDVFSADVCRAEDTEKLFRWLDSHYSELHGVIHAAADIDTTFIADLAAESSARHFSAKVVGTENIVRSIEHFGSGSIDFCMLFSSLSTVLGGMGFANYAASNCVMDSLAHSLSVTSDIPLICVNWDGWGFPELEAQQEGDKHDSSFQSVSRYDFSEEEGMILFQRIIDLFDSKLLTMSSSPQVIISTGELMGRYQKYVCEVVSHKKANQTKRPKLTLPKHDGVSAKKEYQAPASEIEKTMVGIWQQLLGIAHISVKDSFFDLGGDSLTIVELTRLINAELNTKLATADLFAYSSIAALCDFISGSDKAEIEGKKRKDVADKKKSSLKQFKKIRRNVPA